MKLNVLYEDNHLLAVNKPAGIATQGAAADEESLVDLAKEHLRQKYNKPGNVYLGVVSRLDLPVTGVVVFARTSKAAARLTAAFRDRKVEKTYLAGVVDTPEQASQRLTNYLRHDDRNRRAYVTHANAPEAQLAELSYETIHPRTSYSVLKIDLHTGRKHQIRAQLAKLGHAILGDGKYGGTPVGAPKFVKGIALHAWRLKLEHPVGGKPLTFTAPPPKSWKKLLDGANL